MADEFTFDKEKNWFRRHWIISIFLGIFVLGMFAVIFGGDSESNMTGNVVNEKGDNSVYNMNENIEVDYLSYKITKAESFSEMGTSVINKETSGKFVKVYLEIMNNAKETKDIFTPRFKIEDNQGRVYERLSDDMMYISDYLEFGAQLQPGLVTSGAIVFELPKDSENLELIISGDWLSGSEVRVDLNSVKSIGKDTTQQEEVDDMIEDVMSQCSAPFECSSTCLEYMDVGQKDCPSGQVCCME